MKVAGTANLIRAPRGRTMPRLICSLLCVGMVAGPLLDYTAPDTAEAGLLFNAGVDYGAGRWPYSVTMGDLGGSGTLDLAVANRSSGDVSVLLGLGDGTFQGAVHYATGGGPMSVATGDLDGNGALDLAVANGGGGDVSVLLGHGDGTFQNAVAYEVGHMAYSVAMGDLDGDDALDLVVTNSGSDDVSVLLGHGDGSFRNPVHYKVGDGPVSAAIGDLDGNGTSDLAIANLHSGDVSLLLGHGDGTFRSAMHYAMPSPPRSVATGDLDEDGTPDLAVAHMSGHVSVLINAALEIEIKPFSKHVLINPLSRATIPVASLGSDRFHVGDVDVTTLAFGPEGAAPAHRKGGHPWDINGDGFTDWISHYRTPETGIAFGDTEACVTGETVGGIPFAGCDSINTRPSCGHGFEAALVVPPLAWVGRRMRRRPR